ncbi:RHS repeat domain-containing protein, partial [Flavobacterium chilense]
QITFATTGNIVYIYNAAGQKVQKIVNRSGVSPVTTDYLGGYQYENGILKFFPTTEGYVEPSAGSYKYVYQYKDHLGNVRLSYDKNLVIQEENNYYPFGLKQEGYNTVKNSTSDALKYKYNGKELQDELGLNFYDYGARNYDPALGRWMNIDPMAEKNNFESSYMYVHNNPLKYIDPDGKDGIIVIKGGQITISSKVYLYGSGATKSEVAQMQKDINSKWGGTFSSKSLDGKQSFKVNVKVKVALYEGKEKNDPMIIPESWDPNNIDNFIEVNNDVERSYVTNGDEGEWKSTVKNGSLFPQDDAPHEVGHLLGLKDRYTDGKGAHPGWKGNIMARGSKGKVEQKNIDGILQDAMKAYENWSQDKNNEGKEFRYEIDGRPKK